MLIRSTNPNVFSVTPAEPMRPTALPFTLIGCSLVSGFAEALSRLKA